jgi:NAD(P)-dependent dehydrogenase (short-subunit alcohol dehydrogenase family)
MLGSSVVFQHCDITVYDQQLALFERAENRFGGVDIVVANAGVLDPDDRFAPSQDLTVEPRFPEIDVNLKGTLYTTRIGLDYLRRHKGGDLVILSSIAGFKEAGGLTPYLASKHGIIGILRGLRLTTGPTIRVNAVSPWMTREKPLLPVLCGLLALILLLRDGNGSWN